LPTAPPADAVIHDIADADEDDHIQYGDDQQALLVSFESLPGDAVRRQALAAEAEARNHALDMRQAYLCSDLDSVARRGPAHARVDP
jgi:hypothetical protein